MKFGAKAFAILGSTAVAFGLASATAAAAQPAAASSDVPGCAEKCVQVFAQDVGNGYTVQGLQPQDANGAPDRNSLLVTRHNGAVVSSIALNEVQQGSIEFLDSGQCGQQGSISSCVLTGGVGAHSNSAIAARVDNTNGSTTISDSVLHGAPSATIADLNGDKTPDVTMVESTYDPDYASAPQYQLTYVLKDGKFERTGCSAPSRKLPPAPTAPLTGACYA